MMTFGNASVAKQTVDAVLNLLAPFPPPLTLPPTTLFDVIRPFCNATNRSRGKAGTIETSSQSQRALGELAFRHGDYALARDLLLHLFRNEGQWNMYLLKTMIGLWHVQESLQIIRQCPTPYLPAISAFHVLVQHLNRSTLETMPELKQVPPPMRAFLRLVLSDSGHCDINEPPADALDTLALASCYYHAGNNAMALDSLAYTFPEITLVEDHNDNHWFSQETATALCDAAFAQRQKIFPPFDMLRNFVLVRLTNPNTPLHEVLASTYLANRIHWKQISNGAIGIDLPPFLEEEKR